MAYSSVPAGRRDYGGSSDPADHLSAADYRDHLSTYHGFVRLMFLSAGHVLAVLLLLYFFLMR